MDNLSNELNKLRIDKSRKAELRPETHRGLIWTLVILVCALAAFAGYRRVTAATPVDIVHPRLDTLSQSAVLIATGYVVPHHKIQVGSKIMGRVSWIGVEKGERVKRDQIVVRLEDREYRAQYDQASSAYDSARAKLAELERGSLPEEIDRAQADVQRAEAQLRADEAQYRRMEGLVKEGVATPQSLDDAKGRYDADRASLAALTKTWELVRQGPRREEIDNARSEAARARAAMDYAKAILDAAEIRVPIDGTILDRNVERGEMVTTSFVGDQGAKSFVVTLADLDDLQVELDINQNDFNRIGPDQPCNVVTDAFPDRVYECRVDEIAPEANRQKATVQVKVKFLHPDEHVRPEMNARVTFLDQASNGAPKKQEKLYILPKRAIIDRDAAKAVLVIENGRAEARPVMIDREIGTDVYLSKGLTGSESVIVGEQLSKVAVGDRVGIKP